MGTGGGGSVADVQPDRERDESSLLLKGELAGGKGDKLSPMKSNLTGNGWRHGGSPTVFGSQLSSLSSRQTRHCFTCR